MTNFVSHSTALQALGQADFGLSRPLANALVKSSVQLPQSLTYLAACFDDYGRSLAHHLDSMLQGKVIDHPWAYQSLLEYACSGLELNHLLPHFADAVPRRQIHEMDPATAFHAWWWHA